MLSRLGLMYRTFLRRSSRSNLLRRWLGYDTESGKQESPGLIIIQVDGLSRKQFESAVAKGRLPFLKKMIDRGYFNRVSFYSGLPSTTPAVQAEVMYGVKCAVPAFQFLHSQSGNVFRMFDSECAEAIVAEKFSDAEPLLKDGASFSNIYSGGADEAQCCAETMSLPRILQRISVLRLLLLVPLYSVTIVRVLGLALIEFIVGVGDLMKGLLHRSDRWQEIKFVPVRILISVVLCEWLRIVVKLSAARGLPVIYANFLGYDEHSHRRGPGSRFAHFVLKGIDRVIEDIFKSARRSDMRRYEFVVFSDHGQESTEVYEEKFGQDISDVIRSMIQAGPFGAFPVVSIDARHDGGHNLRDRTRRMMRLKRRHTAPVHISREQIAKDIIVTAMGPLGHIYFPVAINRAVRSEIAQRLVEQHHVPLVIYRMDDGVVYGRNVHGEWILPDDGPYLCGMQHKFASEISEDLIRLSNHPDSGDLIILGWSPDQPPLSFVTESGAHGSIGSDETRGFALLPSSLNITPRVTERGEPYIRGCDLHKAGLLFLQPDAGQSAGIRKRKATDNPRPIGSLRVVTYNIHSCIGIDGRCSSRRIADVLQSIDADVIALQEVDVFRQRSGKEDQSVRIAAALGMFHQFFPVSTHGEEKYGLAILSHYPMQLVRAEVLTPPRTEKNTEARGAIGVLITTDAGPVAVINTHLGLRTAERLAQIRILSGDRWQASLKNLPVIICGDFNAGPQSDVLRVLDPRFRSVQKAAPGHTQQHTFASIFPVRQIDHIFVDRHFIVESADVIRNHDTRTASDHLPLVAELTQPQAVHEVVANPPQAVEMIS